MLSLGYRKQKGIRIRIDHYFKPCKSAEAAKALSKTLALCSTYQSLQRSLQVRFPHDSTLLHCFRSAPDIQASFHRGRGRDQGANLNPTRIRQNRLPWRVSGREGTDSRSDGLIHRCLRMGGRETGERSADSTGFDRTFAPKATNGHLAKNRSPAPCFRGHFAIPAEKVLPKLRSPARPCIPFLTFYLTTTILELSLLGQHIYYLVRNVQPHSKMEVPIASPLVDSQFGGTHKTTQLQISLSVGPLMVATLLISSNTNLVCRDRYQRPAFFHMWSQNSWTSFTEHVVTRLTIWKPDSSSYLGKLVVSRTNGTPMVCSKYLQSCVLGSNHANRYPDRLLALFPCPLTTFPGNSFRTRPKSSLSTIMAKHPPKFSLTWTQKPKQTIFWLFYSNTLHSLDKISLKTSTLAS